MRRQPATILIADDDPDSRTILREILRSQGHCTPGTAPSPHAPHP